MRSLTAIVIRVNRHANTCAQWGTVLSALGTIAALSIAYSAFTVQNAQLKEQIETQAKASAEERERFRSQLDVQRKHLEQYVNAFQNQQTAAFYNQVNATTRFLQDHPSLYDYFKRRPHDNQSAKAHSEMVKVRFQKASSEEQALVLIGVECLADFMDTAYAQRETLRADGGEWNTWCDLLQVFRTVDSLILDGWRRAVRCRRAVPGSQVIGHGPNVGSTPGS